MADHICILCTHACIDYGRKTGISFKVSFCIENRKMMQIFMKYMCIAIHIKGLSDEEDQYHQTTARISTNDIAVHVFSTITL